MRAAAHIVVPRISNASLPDFPQAVQGRYRGDPKAPTTFSGSVGAFSRLRPAVGQPAGVLRGNKKAGQAPALLKGSEAQRCPRDVLDCLACRAGNAHGTQHAIKTVRGIRNPAVSAGASDFRAANADAPRWGSMFDVPDFTEYKLAAHL